MLRLRNLAQNVTGAACESCESADAVFAALLTTLVLVLLALCVQYFRLLTRLQLEKRLSRAKKRQTNGPLVLVGSPTAMKDKENNSSKGSSFKSSSSATQPWEIDFAELRFEKCLAKGSHGMVYKGSWLGTVVAIKRPHKHLAEELQESLADEAELMAHFHHPNIVMFLGACLQPDNFSIVLEYLSRGSLADYLQSEKKIDMSLLHRFATDIARGMKYLHRYNVIQRDLKPQNLLIDDSNNVKVCDFGLSLLQDNRPAEDMTACGTPYWTAPEVILGNGYNFKADVYSFAIILFELLTREEPYGNQPGLEVVIKVAHEDLRPQIPSYCPESYSALIRDCWATDPELRPDFQGVLERLNGIRKQSAHASFNKPSSMHVSFSCNASSSKLPHLPSGPTEERDVPHASTAEGGQGGHGGQGGQGVEAEDGGEEDKAEEGELHAKEDATLPAEPTA